MRGSLTANISSISPWQPIAAPQRNTVDCGLFVYLYMNALSHGLGPDSVAGLRFYDNKACLDGSRPAYEDWSAKQRAVAFEEVWTGELFSRFTS